MVAWQRDRTLSRIRSSRSTPCNASVGGVLASRLAPRPRRRSWPSGPSGPSARPPPTAPTAPARDALRPVLALLSPLEAGPVKREGVEENLFLGRFSASQFLSSKRQPDLARHGAHCNVGMRVGMRVGILSALNTAGE